MKNAASCENQCELQNAVIIGTSNAHCGPGPPRPGPRPPEGRESTRNRRARRPAPAGDRRAARERRPAAAGTTGRVPARKLAAGGRRARVPREPNRTPRTPLSPEDRAAAPAGRSSALGARGPGRNPPWRGRSAFSIRPTHDRRLSSHRKRAPNPGPARVPRAAGSARLRRHGRAGNT